MEKRGRNLEGPSSIKTEMTDNDNQALENFLKKHEGYGKTVMRVIERSWLSGYKQSSSTLKAEFSNKITTILREAADEMDALYKEEMEGQ